MIAKPLTLVVKLGWAVGEFAIASHMAIISIYLLFFLTDVHHLSGTLAGTLILVPRLWNIVTDPLMGGISDRVKSRMGRRRPFLLFGSIVWGAAYCGMFWMPAEWSSEAKSAWFLVLYLAVNTGVSIYHVPYSAMAAEMTRDPRQRLSLIGYKEVAARLSVLLTVLASPFVVALGSDPVAGYRLLGIVTGLLITMSGVVAFVTTRNAPAEAFQQQTMDWRSQIRTFAQNKPLFALSGAYLLTSATDAFYSAMFVFFITIVMKEPAALTGLTYPVGSLASIAMTPVWSRIAVRIGKPSACLLSFAILAVCFLAALALPVGSQWPIFLFMLLLGAAIAGMFLLPSAMVPDTVEHDERICGARREGSIYGAWIFVQQSGMAAGAFLAGVYIDVVGAGTAAGASPWSIRLGFALVPVVLLGIAALFVRRYATLSAQAATGHAQTTPDRPEAQVA